MVSLISIKQQILYIFGSLTSSFLMIVVLEPVRALIVFGLNITEDA